jgi:hypothetical protein
MSDRLGAQITPGDRVQWFGSFGDATEGQPATVLRRLAPDCYLIQLDPGTPRALLGPTPPHLRAVQDQLDAIMSPAKEALERAGVAPIDLQEPFAAEGFTIELRRSDEAPELDEG